MLIFLRLGKNIVLNAESVNILRGTKVCIPHPSTKMLKECMIGDVEHTINAICMKPVNARKRKRDSIRAALDIILTSPTSIIRSMVIISLKKYILLSFKNISQKVMSKEGHKGRIKTHALSLARKATGLVSSLKESTNQGLQPCVPS